MDEKHLNIGLLVGKHLSTFYFFVYILPSKTKFMY